MSNKKFYCGDKDEIPDKYTRRGSRVECLRRGVGVGMFLKEKEIREKTGMVIPRPIVYDESDEDREMRFLEEEKRGISVVRVGVEVGIGVVEYCVFLKLY